MSVKSLYNQKARIKRLNYPTQDAIGGIVQTKKGEITINCRVRRLTALEQPVGGKDGVVATHRLYAEKIDCKSADEIVVDNQIYDVDTIYSLKGHVEVDMIIRK